MNRTLKVLLMSTLLLSACGSTDADDTSTGVDETDTTEEVAGAESDEASESKNDKVEATFFFKDSTLAEESPKEIEYIEDTKDIQGVYKTSESSSFNLGLSDIEIVDTKDTIYQIKPDGTYTSYAYTLRDVIYDEASGQLRLKSLVDGLTSALGAEAEIAIDYESFNFSLDNKDTTMYLTENNEAQMRLGQILSGNVLEIVSGYIVQEFGKTSLMPIETTRVETHLDENGDFTFSDLLNDTNAGLDEDKKKFNVLVGDNKTIPFDESEFSSTTLDSVDLPLITNDDELLSPFQLRLMLDELGEERLAQNTEEIELYFYNNNEALQYAARNGNIDKIHTDTSEYSGYTADNNEMKPEFVMENIHGSIFGFGEDNQIYMYRDGGEWVQSSLIDM